MPLQTLRMTTDRGRIRRNGEPGRVGAELGCNAADRRRLTLSEEFKGVEDVEGV